MQRERERKRDVEIKRERQREREIEDRVIKIDRKRDCAGKREKDISA